MPPRPALRALLIDLSGTLHIGSKPTPGAVKALARLRRARIPLRFCSNTSKEGTADLARRLERIGFDVRPGELWTSLGAVAAVVREGGLKNPYFLLSKSAMHAYIGDQDPQPHTQHDSVVVGLAPELLTNDRLTTAFRILTSNSDSEASDMDSAIKTPPTPRRLIAAHAGRFLRTSDSGLSLGPGPFIAALEFAAGPDSGVRAEVIGKPQRAFFESVLASLCGELGFGVTGDMAEPGAGKSWDGVAIIGDDISSDLGAGALELGLWRVLVQTGKYRQGDESRPETPPDEVHPSFSAFVDDLLPMSSHI